MASPSSATSPPSSFTILVANCTRPPRTLVTSTYDWTDVHPDWEAAVDAIFPVVSETNLRATLGILARTVAPGQGRPGAGED